MAVAHDAVELHAVPCSVRSYFFYSVGSVVPFSPGGSAFLHVVPLIGKIFAFRRDGNRQLVTKLDCLAFRLLGDDGTAVFGYSERYGVGGDGMILCVLDEAVDLHAVPCCVGFSRGGGGVMTVPLAPS